MMVRMSNLRLARNETSKQNETSKLILVWSAENEFAFNPKTVQRFAILNCSYTTCFNMKDFIVNITHIDAIVLDWYSPKMQNTEPRILQKFTVDSKYSSEFKCPDYFNGFLNASFAKNSDIPYDYIEFNNEEKVVPKNSVHFSEVTNPSWMRFRNKTNDNLTLELISNRPFVELIGDQLKKARMCSNMVLKSHFVDNVLLMTFCNSLFTITS